MSSYTVPGTGEPILLNDAAVTRDGDVDIDRLLARGGLPDRGRGGQRPTIGEVRKIDAPPLPSADGIALRGNTLCVARSVNNKITMVRLSCDDVRAAVVSERTCRGADTTTGVAVGGDRLLVTTSRWTPTFTAIR
ncbi:hypothetical protein [Amycolatopsis sp. WGS_07]|uniref:hypothetical protein n=1 Tax=Amycolatopsis sp. WGS_07 TaxID=3076764 RepID=UPI00387396A4